MDNVEKFALLFSDFNLEIRALGRAENNKPYQAVEGYNRVVKRSRTEGKSRSDLKKTLTRLTKEYKDAQRSYKQNKITRQELFDFEWRMFEIQEEIRRIEDDDTSTIN